MAYDCGSCLSTCSSQWACVHARAARAKSSGRSALDEDETDDPDYNPDDDN